MAWEKIKSYLLITFGLLLNALGWVAFLIPAQVVGGGVTGIGAVIYYILDFPLGFTVLIINAVLVCLGIRILGINFALKSIFGIATISVLLIILPKVITAPLVEDRFMSALIGAVLAGSGIGIAMSNGGNSGGSDIIALLVTKYRNISPGRITLYIDIFIIASSYFINHQIETIIYGYVVMSVRTYAMDLIIEGTRQSYQFTIVSEMSDDIADKLGNGIGRGITLINGAGWYSKNDKDILLCVCHRYEKRQILKVINDIDPGAFITMGKVSAVYGKNFDRIKM
ncbi:MAG: YitT family protein [Spirochaetales bacterium]|uniref:YitT family protein n=1 Tax=Candidatus Thalassospirochaeta sargassi TaxID=3119039 RepID=A0AAJ1MIS8_9SPIO|nr:YitT family protein [Spirochaetales bacterium]